MLKIRRPLGRLIFNMGIAIPGKTVFLIETAPRLLMYILRLSAIQHHSWEPSAAWVKNSNFGKMCVVIMFKCRLRIICGSRVERKSCIWTSYEIWLLDPMSPCMKVWWFVQWSLTNQSLTENRQTVTLFHPWFSCTLLKRSVFRRWEQFMPIKV